MVFQRYLPSKFRDAPELLAQKRLTSDVTHPAFGDLSFSLWFPHHTDRHTPSHKTLLNTDPDGRNGSNIPNMENSLAHYPVTLWNIGNRERFMATTAELSLFEYCETEIQIDLGPNRKQELWNRLESWR